MDGRDAMVASVTPRIARVHLPVSRSSVEGFDLFCVAAGQVQVVLRSLNTKHVVGMPVPVSVQQGAIQRERERERETTLRQAHGNHHRTRWAGRAEGLSEAEGLGPEQGL
ncbi:hypothetical protein NHX12_007124 [Muraenolepis orangiensis]|uniref:Uncharacterized protein n=1 Tax=Muraenolepis orangiensis TaxID=630683 RepID=A0A9Q0DMB4_9TELE|nr:hypothetical protein NHX12_007124 [Muraenolepis orangiensis]